MLLPPRFGAEALEGSFLNLVADAGQIGREEAFSAQQLPYGFVTALRFQVDLELFLCGHKPPLFGDGLHGTFGWVGLGHFSVSFSDRRGEGKVPVALRAPFTFPSPHRVA